MAWFNLEHVPLIAMVANVKPDFVMRIVSAIVIAAITAFAASYITVSKMEVSTELQDKYATMRIAALEADAREQRQYLKTENDSRRTEIERLRSEIQVVSVMLSEHRKLESRWQEKK